MTKLSLCMIAPIAMLAASTAHAQQYAGHCSQCQQSQMAYGGTRADQIKDTYHENSIWPQQYIGPSRRAICQSYELMIANGWRRNNLLGKYDFAPDGSGLSEAGRIRVERILVYAPPQRRTIFVQRGVDAEQTARRVEYVQTLASNVYPSVGPVDVQETSMQDDGRPAASVDAVFTGFVANQPPPVLPTSSSGSSSESN